MSTVPCGTGTYYNSYGSRPRCIPCPKNTFQDEQLKTVCKQCPSGMFTKRQGSKSADACLCKYTLSVCGQGKSVVPNQCVSVMQCASVYMYIYTIYFTNWQCFFMSNSFQDNYSAQLSDLALWRTTHGICASSSTCSLAITVRWTHNLQNTKD